MAWTSLVSFLGRSIEGLSSHCSNWLHLVPRMGTAVPGFCLLDNKDFASSLKEAMCQWFCSWFLCLLPGGDISPSIFLLRSRKCFPSELSVFPFHKNTLHYAINF